MLKQRLDGVFDRVTSAARRCGRDPRGIRVVVVGKTHPAEAIAEAIRAGARIVGENYVQEARAKFEQLGHHPVQWHFIGHLQSNKAKYAVRMFDLIHTVDSAKLGDELDRQAQKAGKVQDVLIQVNISGEVTKSGIEEQAAVALARHLATLAHIKVRGLMTIPPLFDDPEGARPYFAALRTLREQIRSLDLPRLDMRELSMGMTGDFEAAIEEGATLVRIGTAIFGERP